MTYTQLQNILPNDEIHYISDSTQFFIDNQIKNRKILNNYSHTSDIFYDIHNWQKT